MLVRCASVRSTRLLPSMFSRVKASACSRTSSHEATNSATSATLQPIILRPSSEQDCDTAHTDLQLLGGGCGAEDGGGDTGASSTLDTDSRFGFLAAGGESAAVRSSGGGGLVAATEAGGLVLVAEQELDGAAGEVAVALPGGRQPWQLLYSLETKPLGDLGSLGSAGAAAVRRLVPGEELQLRPPDFISISSCEDTCHLEWCATARGGYFQVGAG